MTGDLAVLALGLAAFSAVLAAAGELGRLLELLADRRHIARINRWRDQIPEHDDDPAELGGCRVVGTTPIS